MSKLDATLTMAYLSGKEKVKNFLAKKANGNGELIGALVVIIVVVVLGAIFKDSLKTLLNTALTSIKNAVNGLFT